MPPELPVVVLANPTAGRGKAGRRIGKVDALLRELRVEHRIRVTESPAEMEAAAREEAEGETPIVAVLGGDGTVSCAANGLVGTSAALAVLPAGTGDDFAASLGARGFEAAVRLLANPRICALDAVAVTAGVTRRRFVNVAGAGFDSEVNETANAMRIRLGATGTYVAAVLKTLSRFAPAHYAITIDGAPLEVDAMLAVVGSGRQYGGGMKVLPTAVLDDGLLDICIVEALSKTAFLRAFPRVFRGAHVRHPRVRMLRGRAVTMEANRKLQLYADGERIGPLPAEFSVMPGALRAVVGPGARGIG
jgi:diacylglycerol kinase (ATP)